MKTVALFVAHEGREAELEDLLRAMVTPSRGEAGNLRYDLWREAAEPRRFVLDELYVDEQAVAAHRASPHFQNYTARVSELASRTALLVTPVDILTPP